MHAKKNVTKKRSSVFGELFPETTKTCTTREEFYSLDIFSYVILRFYRINVCNDPYKWGDNDVEQTRK